MLAKLADAIHFHIWDKIIHLENYDILLNYAKDFLRRKYRVKEMISSFIADSEGLPQSVTHSSHSNNDILLRSKS